MDGWISGTTRTDGFLGFWNEGEKRLAPWNQLVVVPGLLSPRSLLSTLKETFQTSNNLGTYKQGIPEQISSRGREERVKEATPAAIAHTATLQRERSHSRYCFSS